MPVESDSRRTAIGIHSRPLLDAALAHGERAIKEGESTPYPDSALAAVLFAAAATEGFINEVADLGRSPVGLSSHPHPMWSTLARELDELEAARRSVQDKYVATLQAFTGAKARKSDEPFQGFDLLMRTRNLIVHPRPSTDLTPDLKPKYPKALKQLVQAGLAHQDHRLSQLDALKTPKVAKWACESAEALIRELLILAPKESAEPDDVLWMLRA